MFPKRHYNVTFMENTPAPAMVFDFNASDEVGNKMVEYSISNNIYGGMPFFLNIRNSILLWKTAFGIAL